MHEVRKTTEGMTTHEMRALLRSHTWINKTNIAHARRAQLVGWMNTHHVLETVAGRRSQRRITTEYLGEAEVAAHIENDLREA